MDTAAGGGQTQAERVYERYYTLISTITARILAGAGTAEDAEECTQDVLWEYLREPGKWDPERGSEQTYLCMLARSRAKSRRSRLLSRREGSGSCSPCVLCTNGPAGRLGSAWDCVRVR